MAQGNMQVKISCTVAPELQLHELVQIDHRQEKEVVFEGSKKACQMEADYLRRRNRNLSFKIQPKK